MTTDLERTGCQGYTDIHQKGQLMADCEDTLPMQSTEVLPVRRWCTCYTVGDGDNTPPGPTFKARFLYSSRKSGGAEKCRSWSASSRAFFPKRVVCSIHSVRREVVEH